MSAAEKLKVLMEALGPEAVLEMTDIPLPQIVAVIEAAVDFSGYDWHSTQHIAGLQHDGHDLRAIHVEDIDQLCESRVRANRALAALDEALS